MLSTDNSAVVALPASRYDHGHVDSLSFSENDDNPCHHGDIDNDDDDADGEVMDGDGGGDSVLMIDRLAWPRNTS